MSLSLGELRASQKRLEGRTKDHTEKMKQKLEKERILAEVGNAHALSMLSNTCLPLQQEPTERTLTP